MCLRCQEQVCDCDFAARFRCLVSIDTERLAGVRWVFAGRLAQLARASRLHREGRGFESLIAHCFSLGFPETARDSAVSVACCRGMPSLPPRMLAPNWVDLPGTSALPFLQKRFRLEKIGTTSRHKGRLMRACRKNGRLGSNPRCSPKQIDANPSCLSDAESSERWLFGSWRLALG